MSPRRPGNNARAAFLPAETIIVTSFAELNALSAEQLNNLKELGYQTMTPVQAATLPAILAGKDVRAQAKTGSGKTAAFGLGLLQHIDASQFITQSLVLCPTRELADQVANALRNLARCIPNIKVLTLCGGLPFSVQRNSLTHAPHIIVATPGRLLDHLQKRPLAWPPCRHWSWMRRIGCWIWASPRPSTR